MPRTSNATKKLQRDKAQREALIRSLTIALIESESIETTLPKAKATRPFAEKLITKAKKGDLHNRRQIISKLHSIEASNYLVDEIAPKLKDRSSGYLRIERTDLRRGDSAQMATISFVDDISKPIPKKADKKSASEPKKVEKSSSTDKETKKPDSKKDDK